VNITGEVKVYKIWLY